MSRPFAAACVALFVGSVAVEGQSSPRQVADIILTDGKVFTADSTHPWAEAVAIRRNRIVAVGTTADVRRLATRGTREIPLAGRVVIPGINDAHDHVGEVTMPGEFVTSNSPTPNPSPAVVLDSLRAISGRVPAGAWLKTTIGITILNDSAVRRDALDRVSAGHPVMLWSWWGHGAILNSAGLRALGIAENVQDPPGGWYERDAAGRLTGRMDEYAEWGALRRLYSATPEREIVAGLRTFADSSLRMGVTTVQDMAGDFTPALTMRAFRDARLPVRVRIIRWSIPNSHDRNEAEWDGVSRHPGPLVSVSGRKWVLDATPTEQNALKRHAYAGRPGWFGRLDFPLDTIRAILQAALKPDAEQLHLHIVGDSTAELVLSAMESLAPDSVWRTRRVRFEHANGIVGPQVARARRLGIVIAQARGGAPLHTWVTAGIPVAYGSDNLRNPFFNMMVAVAARGGASEELLTREQAIVMFTHGSAYAEFAEHEKGTIAPGMLADIAVLSQDIFTVPPQALPGTTSVLTIVNGRVVRDAR